MLNDIVRNTDKLNTIKMTREIPEIVGDNFVSSRILLMTKLTKNSACDKIARPYFYFSLTSQFDVITISVFIQVDN